MPCEQTGYKLSKTVFDLSATLSGQCQTSKFTIRLPMRLHCAPQYQAVLERNPYYTHLKDGEVQSWGCHEAIHVCQAQWRNADYKVHVKVSAQ